MGCSSSIWTVCGRMGMRTGGKSDLYDNFINECKSFEHSDNTMFKASFLIEKML